MKNLITSLFLNKYIQKIGKLAMGHKVISFVSIAVVFLLGYWIFGGSGDSQNRYILGTVERGTITIAVSGSGQISASNEVEIKSKASGDVVWVGAKSGQELMAGNLILQLDARDAEKAVRDAEINLENAKISLAKIKKPAEYLSLIQAENSLADAKEKLGKSYDDSFTAVTNSFLDLPGVILGLQGILYGNEVGGAGQDNISAYSDMVKTYNPVAAELKDLSASSYAGARASYDAAFENYKSVSRSSSEESLLGLINQTYETVKIFSEALKNADSLLSLAENELEYRNFALPPALAGHQALMASFTAETNSHLSSLSNIWSAVVSAKRLITEKTESFEKIKIGADELDLASQELAVRQRENSLRDAKEKLADYFIRAPFNGTLADLGVKKSDSVSSGTVLGVMISKDSLAEISLNEVDIAGVKIGQKTRLTFDAMGDLNIEGEVSEVDILGLSSQGVVTYDVKIAFKAQDERIKPGMSVTADIVTQIKPDVLVVPNSAVKSQGRIRYVEILDAENMFLAQGNTGVTSPTSLSRKNVEIGLSDDTNTEITGGLNEGDQIIIRTVTNGGNAPSQSAPSLFGPTGGSRSGGNIRIQR